METIPESALENFYKMVLKDFVQITEKYITGSKNNTEEAREVKDKTEEKANDTINELYNTSYLTIIAISDRKSKDPKLYESINNYIFDIKDYIDSRKEKIIDILKTEEKDIYRAYGFLWSVRYLLNDAKLDQISLFNYTQYPHLSNFLEKFGNSKNISKNYNKNFMDDRIKEKNDMKLVHDWIGKLNEGKLSPMTKKSAKSLKKKKKKEQSKTDDNQTAQISSNNNNNEHNKIENSAQKVEKEESSNNIINIEKEISKNNITNATKEKNKEIIEKETEDSSDDKNKSINQNTISSNNSINNENETINCNNDSDKNKKLSNDIATENKLDAPSLDLAIKSEKNNLIDLCKNIATQNPEISQLINILSSQFTSLENKITQQNLEILKHESEISALKTKNENLSERVKKLEVNQSMFYHQISLYQNSRDIYKSISYYFYDFLNLKQVQTTNFGKTKAIIQYLENTDKEKEKEMINNGSKSIDENLKKKITNYFRFHYFIYLTTNKIIHRNFTESQKEILEEQKDNDLLPLLPNFDFDQCFNSLEYFIDNNAKNEQIKKAMKYVYENIYVNDNNLEKIKDENHEIIEKNENGVYIRIKKEDIREVRNYFKSIKMENEDDFIDLCNNKTWDLSDKN